MCILFTAVSQHPEYPLIICANRDEFHSRPTQRAAPWLEPSPVLAGKDLIAGGTWLGINHMGGFAAITNLRVGRSQLTDKRSRGELPIKFLSEPEESFTHWLHHAADDYNPFNLVYGSAQALYCFNSMTKTTKPLSAGFHSVSNGNMDDIWPKMAKGQQALENAISEQQLPSFAGLQQLLRDQTKAKDSQLPDTGISYEWEKKLSSIFIQNSDYGTRSSTILLYHVSGNIEFYEQNYKSDGSTQNESHYKLKNGAFEKRDLPKKA
ncbi:NRDE family protein [Aliikangiella marina]|uniref:NRDE family protein n=1 Tax=Aliikangiella marina TaxID=1712262 RepID=A0A545TCL5_9GAMM|nr:NRDE family protein [Aliikangiella marina]TQV74960.1 NRDE family protein [Aliikangiella marina]